MLKSDYSFKIALFFIAIIFSMSGCSNDEDRGRRLNQASLVMGGEIREALFSGGICGDDNKCSDRIFLEKESGNIYFSIYGLNDKKLISKISNAALGAYFFEEKNDIKVSFRVFSESKVECLNKSIFNSCKKLITVEVK